MFRRRSVGVALSVGLIASSFVVAASSSVSAQVPADPDPQIRAGYGEADSTWHVGAGAGQYTEKTPQDVAVGLAGEEFDPHNHSVVQTDSYGVQSRLSFRAIVVDDGTDQTAFVKSDNYLAMDALARRVGQILLLEGSSIEYDEIFHMATHNHYSPMYSTPSWGVWLFQDAFDLRAYEYQARQMAAAILEAEANLVPAKMGATTVEHRLFKGMVARSGIAEDGTPVGYPSDFGDFGLSVLRFDTLDNEPIATLINWGMHPEGLQADNLITAEFLAPLQRFVERATGGGVVFGQGDVGSAESGPANPYELPAGVFRQWDNAGHAQVERGAYFLAQDVIKAWKAIGDGVPVVPRPEFADQAAFVPFDSTFDVGAGNYWAPGPYSHPVPTISNCRSENSVKGDTGGVISGLPDCDRGDTVPYPDHPFGSELGQAWDLLQAEGVPVPAHYGASSFTGVQENLRLHLQAFKLGEVILLSCACEAQVDLILNLESRVDETQDNLWLGFDWTKRLDCQPNTPSEGQWTCSRRPDPSHPSPRSSFDQLVMSDAAYQRMLAQIYNDAEGWDLPENALAAETDPDDITKIWGNFTHEELPEELGYKLAIGVGHAGDYNGYTVSYREYMAYDHYRKALTSHGPHTADYMNSRLMELAGELNGAPDELDPLETEEEARALADEARQVAYTTALGAASAAAWEGWTRSLPNDLNAGEVVAQPDNIKRFAATTFSWKGGSNAIDNPTVTVERLVDGEWQTFADQSGEIQTRIKFPAGTEGLANTYSGNQEWVWTANFEAFDAFPAGIGSTPEGTYRFVVNGRHREGFMDATYELTSDEFTVSSWDGIEVRDLRQDDAHSVSFEVAPIAYPETYESVFPYVTPHTKFEADRGELKPEEIRSWCDTCSFRPWATSGEVESAVLTIDRAGEASFSVPAELGADGRWHAPFTVVPGDEVYVAAGDVVDNYGETNATGTDSVFIGLPNQAAGMGLLPI
jgi:hypothetical protein